MTHRNRAKRGACPLRHNTGKVDAVRAGPQYAWRVTKRGRDGLEKLARVEDVQETTRKMWRAKTLKRRKTRIHTSLEENNLEQIHLLTMQIDQKINSRNSPGLELETGSS